MNQSDQKSDAENAYQEGEAAKKLYMGPLGETHDPSIYLKIAQHHFALKEYSDAQAVCQKGIDVNPNSAELHVLLGKIFYQQNNLHKAEKEAMMAIKLNESLPGAYIILSGVRFLQKKYSEAIHNAEIAIKMDPDIWIAHYLLGVALGHGIDQKKAIDELKIAYKLNPSIKLGLALLLQFVVANRIWVSILLLLLIMGALVTGKIALVVLGSLIYFTLGIISFTAQKKIPGLFLMCVAFIILGLYFFFW